MDQTVKGFGVMMGPGGKMQAFPAELRDGGIFIPMPDVQLPQFCPSDGGPSEVVFDFEEPVNGVINDLVDHISDEKLDEILDGKMEEVMAAMLQLYAGAVEETIEDWLGDCRVDNSVLKRNMVKALYTWGHLVSG